MESLYLRERKVRNGGPLPTAKLSFAGGCGKAENTVKGKKFVTSWNRIGTPAVAVQGVAT
jgi:hypothetical protein